MNIVCKPVEKAERKKPRHIIRLFAIVPTVIPVVVTVLNQKRPTRDSHVQCNSITRACWHMESFIYCCRSTVCGNTNSAVACNTIVVCITFLLKEVLMFYKRMTYICVFPVDMFLWTYLTTMDFIPFYEMRTDSNAS